MRHAEWRKTTKHPVKSLRKIALQHCGNASLPRKRLSCPTLYPVIPAYLSSLDGDERGSPFYNELFAHNLKAKRSHSPYLIFYLWPRK